ncbi:MAG: hypothetical protein HUU10_10760 [Bacteroidetes bacterium]|nr:hypothetical protein [Bacteroidota bacterium]
MIRIFLLLLFLTGLPIAGFSCDFCNNLNGVNPHYTGKNLIALNWLVQHSELDAVAGSPSTGFSKIAHGGHGTTATGYQESRQTLDLTILWHLSPSWMVQANLPWQANRLDSDGITTSRWVGDMGIMTKYVISNPASGGWYRYLIVGGGLELPTGNNHLKDGSGQRLPMDLQIGSGSTDLLASLLWIDQWDTWTVASDWYLKYSTKNRDDYQVGSSLTTAASVAHDLWRNNSLSLAAVGMTGLRFEKAGADADSGSRVKGTGSSTLFLQATMKIYYQSLRWYATALVPTWTSRPSGSPAEHTRLATGISWEWE